jgi:hypothetical protein
MRTKKPGRTGTIRFFPAEKYVERMLSPIGEF